MSPTIRPSSPGLRRWTAVLSGCVLGLVLNTQAVYGAAGDKVAEIFPPDSAFGVSVAFDGQFLYYTNFDGTILHRIAPSNDPLTHTDVVILGAPGINAFSYDATRDRFWAAGSDGLSIYLLDKSGIAILQFVLDPVADRPGNCDTFGCLSLIDGLAYDGATDTLWYSPDASQRIYHYDTLGQLLGFFDVNDPPNDMPECQPVPGNYSSGVAAGANDLYLQADGCDTYFRYNKTGTKLASFAYDGARAEDSECDDVTFNVDVIWVRDVDGRLAAFEQPTGTCLLGGGVIPQPGKARMTGGGNFVASLPVGETVHHGFMLHCNKDIKPNRLQVNWHSGDTNNRFHLETLDTASCIDDPLIEPNPPGANFDTHRGTGTGRYNGVSGATIEWTFKDAGEPGTMDSGCIRIKDGALPVLEVGNCPALTTALVTGNHQAHNSN